MRERVHEARRPSLSKEVNPVRATLDESLNAISATRNENILLLSHKSRVVDISQYTVVTFRGTQADL